jgi:hypothetical protein
MLCARGLTTLQTRGSRTATIAARSLKSWETYFNTRLVLQLKFEEIWRHYGGME